MATTLNSPGIAVREIDLSGVVPSNTTSIGAIVGNYRWGPVGIRSLISNEKDLVTNFGTPTATSSVDFHSAAYFLKYTSNLFVTRQITSAAYNATSNTQSGADTVLVKNEDHYNTQYSGFGADSGEVNSGMFIAKYPGTLGNSLKVSFCVANATGTGAEDFADWTYNELFDGAPGTSDYADVRGASNDEIHLVVVDENGTFTGTPGTVLEKFAYLSVAPSAKTSDGSTNYVGNVLNNASNYIWFGFFDTAALPIGADAGSNPTTGLDYTEDLVWTNALSSVSLNGGVDSGSLGTAQYITGYDLYADKETVIVDFLIAPDISTVEAHNTVVNNLIASAVLRKDCVVIASPNRASVVNNTGIVDDTVTCFGNVTKSSYLFKDNNYLKVYDKYNDQYIYIPAASSTAGIFAATDLVAAPFFSPAGPRRGQYMGITALAYSATQSERDTLYKVGINSIANIPGQGIMLYGDKTGEARPSAFDRINVRRLFLMIERAIAIAARNVMFEFNDEFTRAEFVNIVEPYLRNIKGRRGIYDFRVVCDDTNNTPDVIDNNEFIASIFVKPARSINYVTLNFVAVRTGASFEEVVGTI